MINATGIGSVPHKDVKTICNFILDKFPDIPFWPQLFKVAPTENMFMQFSENLPCLEHDLDRKTVRVNKKIRNRNNENDYPNSSGIVFVFIALKIFL